MSSPKVTYAFYKEYGGTLEEDGFNAALPHALAAVRRLTWPNDPAQAEDAYKRAVCAAVDVDSKYGYSGGIGENISSMTVGAFSVSVDSGSANFYQQDMWQAIEGELIGTGLLFQGIGQ